MPPPDPADRPRPSERIAGLVARLPLDRLEARTAPSWRAVLALTVVGLVAVVVATWALARGRPSAVPVPPVRTPGAAVPSAASPSPTAAALLVVDVVGPVRHPGVVRLPAGARVLDAVAAAGGLRPGTSPGGINLAAPLTDGQQVVVGGPAPVAGASAPPTGAGTATGAVVDLNTATAEQLDTLPGVGPVLAQRIVDWRTAHGRFASVDQLGEVGGIGERRLAELRSRVRV